MLSNVSTENEHSKSNFGYFPQREWSLVDAKIVYPLYFVKHKKTEAEKSGSKKNYTKKLYEGKKNYTEASATSSIQSFAV